jgi:hypothetical protein
MTKVLFDGNGSDIVQIVGKGLFVPLASREALQLKLDGIEAAHALELDAAKAQAKHWKANHDAQVERARLMIERVDMPVERVQAYQLVRQLMSEREVFWHSPDTVPAVAEGSLCLCWIAVRQHYEGTEPRVLVFAANYINKPLFLDEDGEPTAEDYHVTADGEPVGAVGWHNEHHHPEFSAYYEEILFSDSYQLLGWSEYKPPMWGAFY